MSELQTQSQSTTLPLPPVVPTITLTDEQLSAVAQIKDWFNSGGNQEFKLGGYAGTGKTTIIKVILKELKELEVDSAVMAFTGKACSVLVRKGVPASTIHSNCYDCCIENGVYIFTRRSRILGNPDLVIVDEASMISTTLYNDLKAFGVKLLFVGDPGQLEPVGDNPNLMAKPDFVLTKIHRQASLSPIIQLATDIRGGISMPKSRTLEGLSIRDKNFTIGLVAEHEQLICARNKTRVSFNDKIRIAKRLPSKTIQLNEKLIVLRNNPAFNVYNGLILFVDAITHQEDLLWNITCHDEVDKKYENVLIWKRPFLDPELKVDGGTTIPKVDKKSLVIADYGYAITCHKAQGSEWGKVIIYDEWMPPSVWSMKRWRYTAITRAAKELTYCI